MNLKICPKCTLPKPATKEFYSRHTRSKDGLQSYCKICDRERTKARLSSIISEPQYDLGLFKICSLCKISKEIVKLNFAICKQSSFGVSPHCRECNRTNNEKHKKVNRGKERPIKNFVSVKKCSHCEDVFPTTAFSYNKSMKDGLSAICKFCNIIKGNARRVCGDPIDIIAFNKKVQFYNNKCAYCKINPYQHIDHFYPLHPKGGGVVGGNHIDNLFPSCAACNISKRDNDPIEWMRDRFPDEKKDQLSLI